MSQLQFQGRSTAEAAIKACEKLGVTRSTLKYNIVSESGEGIDKVVVIAVEPPPEGARARAPEPRDDSRPPREDRPPRDDRPPREDRRPESRDRGPRRVSGGRDRDRDGGSRGRRDGRRDGGRDRSSGGRGRPGERRGPGADRPPQNGIDDLLDIEAFAAEAGEARPDVTSELSSRAAKAKEMLGTMLAHMGLKSSVHVVQDDAEEVHIDVRGTQEERLIGKKFENLLSLQFLLNRMVSRHSEGDQVVVLDVAGYRGKRRAALADLSKRLAQRALEERKVVKLSPMSAHDRRVFHLTLTELEGVTTRSEGDGMYRHLLIIPSEFSAGG